MFALSPLVLTHGMRSSDTAVQTPDRIRGLYRSALEGVKTKKRKFVFDWQLARVSAQFL